MTLIDWAPLLNLNYENYMSVRYWTNELLAAVEDGSLDGTQVLTACLGYMSEANVRDFAESEGYDELIGVDAYCQQEDDDYLDEYDEDEIALLIIEDQPMNESPINRG